MHDNTEFARALLQDQEQLAPRAAAETVAADPMHGTAEMHGDIVPIGKLLRNATIARGIVFFEIVEGSVGEDDPKAERVIGAVAFVDGDFGVRPLLAKQ